MPVDFGLWLGWNEVRGLLHYKFVKGERVSCENWADFELTMAPELWANEAGFQAQVQKAMQRHVAWKSNLNILSVLPIRTEDRPQGALILGSHGATHLTEPQLQIAAIAGSQAAAVYERHQGALNTTRLATMGNMISEIAHDLKKPLTNLKGSLQLLQQKHPELEESNPFFQSADQEIHHAAGVRPAVDVVAHEHEAVPLLVRDAGQQLLQHLGFSVDVAHGVEHANPRRAHRPPGIPA